ncbi:NAD(P)H-dependent oxidoreductase [Sediminivirga luteola]|uniref:Homoserine dehydrogenase n=1 Tax=Sediminivirga luteola TaxID=1774748 RepID=A0A8J2XC12_9MICO|nr:oxidoreductase [Sediminivirga luteola]GGA03368.1 homoserine dehydrogenase [Sediminivirga luteola]
MSYTRKLLDRQAELGRPVRVGLVGAGQMGSGFIAQIARQKGVDISAVADIDPARAVEALRAAGIGEVTREGDLAARIEAGGHVVVADAVELTRLPVDIVIECSGVPDVAARVAFAALLAGRHTALMTVEADVTVGLLLSRIAAQTGAVYTVCRGDEPVECLKLVEYVQDIGLDVVFAGKGKNNPLRPQATAEELTEEARTKGMNPRMLCSFVDGTKTMIEMAALANAADLQLTQRGLTGPAATVGTLHEVFRPVADGGVLERHGVVDYATGPVAPGVFVIGRTDDPVVREELEYLKMGSGPYFSFYRPYHLASVEAVLSIGEAVCDGQSSLAPVVWNAEVTAVAKRDLTAGRRLEGIGGADVRGEAVPAAEARTGGELPVGLASAATLRADVPAGRPVRYQDVDLDESSTIVQLRRLQDGLLRTGTLTAGPLAEVPA